MGLTKKQRKKAKKLTTRNVLDKHGYKDLNHVMELSVRDKVRGVPALCYHGCIVEPDGRCQHGHDSVLVANGLM